MAAQSTDEEKGTAPVDSVDRSREKQQRQQSKHSDTAAILKAPLSTRLRDHLVAEISFEHTDLLLITCFFISGLLDSVAFNTWGAFFSMQTGNTIFLAINLVRIPITSPADWSWVRSGCAIGGYILGVIFFAFCHRHLRTPRRVTLVTSFGIQTIFIFVAAALVQGGVASDIRENGVAASSRFEWTNLAPLIIVAFQSAGQMVASRELGLGELPTNVLTSLYTDLMSDPKLLTASWNKNVKRNRRAAGILCLFAGAVVGAAMSVKVRMSAVLWLAGGIKAVVVVAWLFWNEARKLPI